MASSIWICRRRRIASGVRSRRRNKAVPRRPPNEGPFYDRNLSFVLPGLDPGIHEAARRNTTLTVCARGYSSWIAGSGPAKTNEGLSAVGRLTQAYVGML